MTYTSGVSSQVRVGLQEMPCPACGYDLRGTQCGCCPEGGTEVRRGRSASRLPWVVARGFWASAWAYVVTVVLIGFRPRTLAGEVRRRVSRRRATWFARISVGLIALAIA